MEVHAGDEKGLGIIAKSYCVECGEEVKLGNKFCKKVACRVQHHFRKKIEAEIKAKVAGESQKYIAKEVLSAIDYAIMRSRDSQENQIALNNKLMELKKLLNDFIKKPK